MPNLSQFITHHGTHHWCCSALVCLSACVFLWVHGLQFTINLIAVKPDVSFCWGLTGCQLTKCLTCFYLHYSGKIDQNTCASSLPVTGSSWSNRLWLYPCAVLVPSSEVVSGPIHSGLPMCGLCHNIKYFFFFFFYHWMNPSLTSSSPSSSNSSSFFSSSIPMLKRLATQLFTGHHCCHLQSLLYHFERPWSCR